MFGILTFLWNNPNLLSEYEIARPIAVTVITFAVIWLIGRSSTDLQRLWRWYRGTWKSTRLGALHDVLEWELGRVADERRFSLSKSGKLSTSGNQPERTKRRSKILFGLEKISLRFPKQHQLQDWHEYLGELAEHSLRSDYRAAKELTELWERIIATRSDPYTRHPREEEQYE